ncbi:ComEC/Rec2 family competence protein [Pseudomonas sp. PH1b]|uniref:ComEC/Rec2 family competence protein n=1 Tax=Pseudomonas sp. PH1b TaxID=1397282 RepID=UPI000E1FCCA8|nr:MBL fold metallo-hydrolase [Pseudomonas sp. PH1b]
MFKLELLPACEGDCLILSWGNETIRRILIDGGRSATAESISAYVDRHQLKEGAFELLIVTHIDRDHIEGAVELLKNTKTRKLIKEVWFNSRVDLEQEPLAPGYEEFGPRDGERLSRLINQYQIPNNQFANGNPVAVLDEVLPVIPLPGGLVLTVLSPEPKQLSAIIQSWDYALEEVPEDWEAFGLPPPIDIDFLAGKVFRKDSAKPNGTSIAVVAEFEGKHVLLTGDAHVQRLLDSLVIYRKMHPDLGGFSLVKASHHGSQGNTSLELVRALQCSNWAVSTNGSQFKHPDKEAIARIIAGSPKKTTLYFNYNSKFTSYWQNPFAGGYSFGLCYGQDGYISIDIA